jgi:hypothetical protein
MCNFSQVLVIQLHMPPTKKKSLTVATKKLLNNSQFFLSPFTYQFALPGVESKASLTNMNIILLFLLFDVA